MIPNRGINHDATKTIGMCLSWTHRKLKHIEFGALMAFPWKEKMKLLKGRMVATHFDCCVLSVLWLCAVGLSTLTFYYPVQLTKKLDLRLD
jgi:hypothetical protein